MREIKFRAWDGYTDDWVRVFSDIYEFTPRQFLEDGIDSYREHYYKAKNLTWFQYTGLKDKNGKTYCQDDIVNHKGRNYRLIKGSYMFELLGFSESSQDNPSDFFSEGAYITAEIIGNIHENPELIK